MYSPPMPRAVEAILAKLSEPRNCLGLMIMYSPFSSKLRRASSSSGKDMRMSSMLRCFEVSCGAVDREGMGAVGFGADVEGAVGVRVDVATVVGVLATGAVI